MFGKQSDMKKIIMVNISETKVQVIIRWQGR